MNFNTEKGLILKQSLLTTITKHHYTLKEASEVIKKLLEGEDKVLTKYNNARQNYEFKNITKDDIIKELTIAAIKRHSIDVGLNYPIDQEAYRSQIYNSIKDSGKIMVEPILKQVAESQEIQDSLIEEYLDYHIYNQSIEQHKNDLSVLQAEKIIEDLIKES